MLLVLKRDQTVKGSHPEMAPADLSQWVDITTIMRTRRLHTGGAWCQTEMFNGTRDSVSFRRRGRRTDEAFAAWVRQPHLLRRSSTVSELEVRAREQRCYRDRRTH